MTGARLAPAKVNLFLHVGRPQPDGYHPVASWMVFADTGDRVTLEPASAWSFAVTGPYAGQIGPGENLVEAAAARLFARAGCPPPDARLVLDKQLPVAAGLGGGSSDAGAALRLLNAALDSPLAEPDLVDIAAGLGADGPACLAARAVLATGRGDALTPAPETPALPAVLVNPGRPSPTAAVYRAYDAAPQAAADAPILPGRFSEVREVAAALTPLRNDLEAPAQRLEPAIGAVLEALRDQPETLLARMSGSGATCFALCASDEAAEALARRVGDAQPGWWIKRCRLSEPITNS